MLRTAAPEYSQSDQVLVFYCPFRNYSVTDRAQLKSVSFSLDCIIIIINAIVVNI